VGTRLGDHAVIIGGSIAGLLAARAVADFYERVTVLEREIPNDVPVPRKAIPQGHHIHALLARGQQILEGFFPGLTDELIAEGVPVGDFGTSLTWYVDGRAMRKAHTDMLCVAAGRPLLETRLRAKVSRLPNVDFCPGTTCSGLLTDTCGSTVTGVTVTDDSGTARKVEADLVVEASGRASRLPKWLAELSYPSVAEEVVRMGLTYTTCDFHLRPEYDPIGDDIALLPLGTPTSPRGAIYARLADRYAISLTGVLGDKPPRDYDEMLAYVKSLPTPEIYQSVRTATPMGPAASFAFPASIRRRYDRMRDFPAGLVVLGDASAVFNPVYGQGMTVAALGADLLHRHLQAHEGISTNLFLRAQARVLDAPWRIAAGSDLGFAKVEGERTLATKLANSYITRLQHAATEDPHLTRAFLRVAGLVDPMSALAHPSVVARTMRSTTIGRLRAA